MDIYTVIEATELALEEIKKQEYSSEKAREQANEAYEHFVLPALRKEVPKKPIASDDAADYWLYCPTCHKRVRCQVYVDSPACHPYRCMWCGQVLAW